MAASTRNSFIIKGSRSKAQVCRKPCFRCYLGLRLSIRLGVRDHVGQGLVLCFVSYSHFGCVKRARRRPSYHLPSVPFAHLYGARPEQASLLLAFLLNLPPLWRAAGAGQLIVALLLHIARGPSGPAYHCLAAPHSTRLAASGPAYHCLAAPHSARPERASLPLPCCST